MNTLFANPLGTIVFLYLIVINVICFILCGLDKFKAKHDMWRVRESTFFILSALGGSLLMLAGMNLFRHKTKHIQFTVGIPFILIVQIVLIVFLQSKFGLVTWLFG